MKLNFVLPGLYTDKVVGGFRVHYEYANRLALAGHEVVVSHMINADATDLNKNSHLRNIVNRGVRDYISWFNFNPKVFPTVVVNGRFLLPCDVLILTSWHTAEAFGKRHDATWLTVQIAYDYEFWMTADESLKARMASAFRAPDLMVSTSNSVQNMLSNCGRVADAKASRQNKLTIFKKYVLVR
ncbi:MAG: hypothetical protein ACOYNZ_19015, partial [Rhodoferax sp.]